MTNYNCCGSSTRIGHPTFESLTAESRFKNKCKLVFLLDLYYGCYFPSQYTLIAKQVQARSTPVGLHINVRAAAADAAVG